MMPGLSAGLYVGVFGPFLMIGVRVDVLEVCADALLVAMAIAPKVTQDIANDIVQDIALKKREDIAPKIEQKKIEKKLRMLRR